MKNTFLIILVTLHLVVEANDNERLTVDVGKASKITKMDLIFLEQ